MTSYDTAKLQALGKRRRKLAAELAEINAEIDTEIPVAAAAKVPQDSIIEWTGLTRATVQRKEQGARRWRQPDS